MTKYSEKYCEIIIELMSEGASIEEVAAELGVVKQTLYNWMNSYPEFKEAKMRGEQLSKAWWMRQGRIALRDKEFSPTLFYMNMKNRFGWSDKQETKETSKFTKESVLDALEREEKQSPTLHNSE